MELGALYPEAVTLIGEGKNRKSLQGLVELHYDDESLRAFHSAGIDLDPATWTLQLRLRGGTEVGFACSVEDASRLERNFDRRDRSTPFFLFDSSRVAAPSTWTT